MGNAVSTVLEWSTRLDWATVLGVVGLVATFWAAWSAKLEARDARRLLSLTLATVANAHLIDLSYDKRGRITGVEVTVPTASLTLNPQPPSVTITDDDNGGGGSQ